MGAPYGEIRHSPQEKPQGAEPGRQEARPQGRGFQVEKAAEAWGLPSASLEPDSPSPPSDTQSHWTWVCGWAGLPCPRVLAFVGGRRPPSRDNFVSVYSRPAPLPRALGRALCAVGTRSSASLLG